MRDWWLVRAAEYKDVLAVEEWEKLAASGQALRLAPKQSLTWGVAAGVVLVRRGVAHLYTETLPHLDEIVLRQGDMVGALQQCRCRLRAEQETTLCVFRHSEWIHTLHTFPDLSQKLLQGVAWNALLLEQQLPPHNSSVYPS